MEGNGSSAPVWTPINRSSHDVPRELDNLFHLPGRQGFLFAPADQFPAGHQASEDNRSMSARTHNSVLRQAPSLTPYHVSSVDAPDIRTLRTVAQDREPWARHTEPLTKYLEEKFRRAVRTGLLVETTAAGGRFAAFNTGLLLAGMGRCSLCSVGFD